MSTSHRVRIQMTSLKCIEASDEIGLFENDEPYVLWAGRDPSGPVRGRSKTWSIDEDEKVLSKKKPLRIWEGDLAPGERVRLTILWREKDGGGKDAEKIVSVLQQAAADDSHGGGDPETTATAIEGTLVDLIGRFIAYQVLGRGEDDYLGSAVLVVENIDGEIRKHAKTLAKTKVRKLEGAARTLKMRSSYYAAADNEVTYEASLEVHRIGTGPLAWRRTGERDAA